MSVGMSVETTEKYIEEYWNYVGSWFFKCNSEKAYSSGVQSLKKNQTLSNELFSETRSHL